MPSQWIRTCRASLLGILLAGSAQAAEQAALAPTPAEIKDIQHLVAVAPPHAQPGLIDLSDASQERAFRALLRINGVNPTTRPQMFRMLEQVKKNHLAQRAKTGKAPSMPERRAAFAAADAPADDYAVLNIGTNDWKTIDSTAFSTLYNGSHYSNTTVTVQDATGEVIKTNRAEEWDAGRDMAVDSGSGENKPGKDIDAVGTFFGEDSTGKPYGPYYTAMTGGYYPKQIVNDKPVITTTNPNIVVCLNRANPDPTAPTACDYGPTDPNHNPPNIKFPFKGSVQYFGNIDVDPATGKPKPGTFSVTLSLTGRTTGGNCKLVDIGSSFMNNPNTKITGDTITWDLEPADFGPVCWVNNEYYTLTLALMVSISNVPVWATITNAPNTKPTVSTLLTKELQIQYGCIVEGTLITMADGSKRPIETLKRGDEVLTRDGRHLRVEWRTTGWDTETLRLTDSAGDEVRLTPLHPVPTGRGVLQARDLKAGDTIFAATGKVTLKTIKAETSPKAVAVYNLGLIGDDGKALADPEAATFYAGSVLVGDAAMQGALMHPKREMGQLRSRVPASWRQDFDNWAAEQKKAAKP